MIAMKHLVAFEESDFVMMSLTKLMITNESPDEELLRSGPHTATLIL